MALRIPADLSRFRGQRSGKAEGVCMRRALLLVSIGLLALCGAKLARADASYADSTGDSGTAPDIRIVTAANDASGALTFTVRTNQQALTEGAAVRLAFDLDQNALTGSKGADALFVVRSGGWEFVRWNGSRFVAQVAASATASYAAGQATFRIGKADLGATERFAFRAETIQSDPGGAVLAEDTAPNGDSPYVYTLVRPFPLHASTVTAVPARPVAGYRFTVGTRVSRADNGAAIASGTVTCTARVGTRSVGAAGRLRNGIAICSLRLGTTAKGKMLRGTIKLTVQGSSVSKPFSFRVR